MGAIVVGGDVVGSSVVGSGVVGDTEGAGLGGMVVAFEDGDILGAGDTVVSFPYEYPRKSSLAADASSTIDRCRRRFFFCRESSLSKLLPIEVATVNEIKDTRRISRREYML